MKRRPLRFRLPSIGVLFALAVAAVLACNNGHDKEDKNQFRDDVIWCEEAVARLEKCCPSFDPQKVLCNFYYSYDEGCGTSTTVSVNPALTTSDSLCIRDTSCDALVAQNVCSRAEAAGIANGGKPTTTSSTSSSTSSSSSGFSSSSGTSSSGFSSTSSSSGFTSTSSSSGSTTPSTGPVCP